MSTQKSHQPGAPAHKHITFTPASEVNGSSEQSTASDNAASDRASRQNNQQKSWLDQQQWLKNIDVNQLSQQVKDLSAKAKDFSTKAVDQVNSLTPTQKVIGGALLVGGLSWLALRAKSSPKGETYRGSRDEDTTWKSSSDSVYRGATRSFGEDDYATDL
ncbi:hypothetical protein [Hymenobacter metallilatus]|uniref:DUF3618 domain-containing protein n=1 Tax=Hymenobacter metallilatus TaxID=2493666 RepID=A0A428JDC7_9BACT|nr:hypothetical protein [Hymenobacter metallilatus]RSK30179.1 hypothetical protein EI290_15105 [Hymenobacter metallilatus]